jgi:hypothetical protein
MNLSGPAASSGLGFDVRVRALKETESEMGQMTLRESEGGQLPRQAAGVGRSPDGG